jgi:NADH-quinone oxidoreductase subunit J
MQYEFIAAVQIVVYVGGITVLIIFSIFLTQQAGEAMPAPIFSNKWAAALACVFGWVFLLLQFRNNPFAEIGSMNSPSMKQIGSRMLDVEETGYALPFELVSILLLAAMIGCIVIAMRPQTEKEN